MTGVCLCFAAAVAGCAEPGAPAPDAAPDLGTVEASLTTQAIARRSAWRYWDRGGHLGTAWAAPSFDVSSWASGAGPLGYGESYLQTTVGYGPSATNKHITTYFRAQFTVTDPAQVTRLLGEVMYDDGIVVFLNGTRIGSDFMPSGPSNGSTRALGHETGNAYLAYDWTAQRPLLVAGVNTIGVEVHQVDPGSSDLVFDLGLTIETSATPPPPGQDIARRSTWTYWDRGGDLGAGWRSRTFDDATWARGAGVLGYGEPYVNTTVSYGPSATNKYRTTYFRNRFTVADPAAVTSMIGELMYDDGAVVYLNGTELARPSMPSGTITASTFAADREAGNAHLTFDWTSARGLLVAGTNVITVEVHQDSSTSSDLIFDLALDVTAGAPPPPTTAGVPRRATWRYQAGPAEPQGWRGMTYDDAGWTTGAAPLGYGEPYLATTLSYGPSASNKWVTTYFRKEFTVDDPDQITGMVGELMYDDGLVVWLNGDRILLVRGLSPYNTSWGTFAATREAGNTYETVALHEFRSRLRIGRNVLAVEVHQDDAGSSDLVFDVALRLERAPPSASFSRRSLWTYRNDGADQGTAWRTATSTAGWLVGYGPFDDYVGDEGAAHITSYYRRSFRVDSPAAVTQIRGELAYQDGAVVYVNGNELARLNMPAGPITASTLALGDHDPDRAGFFRGYDYEAFDWTAARPFLVPGDNVVAVEIHRSAPDALYLDFDLALQVDTAATPRISSDCAPVTLPRYDGLAGVWIAPSGVVWAAGSDGIIGRRSTSGAWTWCTPSLNTYWTEVWGSGDGDVWMVGTGGVVRRWNGVDFDAPDVGTAEELSGVWGTGPSHVFVTGTGGAVRRFDGATWQVADLPAGHAARGVWGANASDVWVGANSCVPNQQDPDHDFCQNEAYRWNAATGAFVLEESFGNENTHVAGIGGSSSNDVWLVGEAYPSGAADSYGFAGHYDGTAWSYANPPDAFQGNGRLFTDVVSRAAGTTTDVWITTDGNGSQGMLRWDGATWTEDQSGTAHLSGIDARGSSMFAVGAEWKVVRWNGASWVRDR